MGRPWRSLMARMTVSTSPSLICRTSCSRVSFAERPLARRVCPLVRSVRRPVRRAAGVTVLRAMGRSSSLLQADEDVLDFGVALQGVHAQLPTDAAALVAAKGRLLVHTPAAVDADHARADRFGHPERPPDIAGPERTREAIGAVVDHGQQVGL